ncbi:MAG: hypothetical protein WDN00_14410 [Limisphaerales bacterium]
MVTITGAGSTLTISGGVEGTGRGVEVLARGLSVGGFAVVTGRTVGCGFDSFTVEGGVTTGDAF